MKKLMLLPLLLLMGNSECDSNKQEQARQGREMAERVRFTENQEQKNIVRRLEETGKPGLIGYIVLFNEMGQPILYTTTNGKVTSGGKRLTPAGTTNGYEEPNDEGTFGSSTPYIYFWTTSGQYIQWSGHYLFSLQPIRVKIPPVVITEEQMKAEKQ